MKKRPDGTMKAMLFAPPLKRLSRPLSPPVFRLTARDIAIIAHVAHFRFLTSAQIAELDGGSHAQVLRRLRYLWAAGFLDRPKLQHAYLANWTDEGNKPLAYALGRLGAKLLRQRGIAINDKLEWTLNNSRVGALHLAHTIDTATAMIPFTADARAVGLHVVDHHELLPTMPEKTRQLRKPFCIRVTVSVPGVSKPVLIGVVPARLFSLVSEDERRNFALEQDESQMSVNAKSLKKSSYRRKLLGYFHAWKQKRHTEVWGFQSFRVLTITPSEKRIDSMIAVQRKITNDTAAGLFLYSTPQRLNEHGPLGKAWRSSEADGISLLDRK